MRWKLLILISILAAIIAFFLWEAAIHLIFAPERPVQPHDFWLLASGLLPLGVSFLAGTFVYRHCARRRKTQAVLTALLTLILGVGLYLISARLFPETAAIPQPCSYPCA